MEIQQTIEEQMQIFEKGFQMGETVVDHRWDVWKGGVLPSDIKSFIKSYGRKLIEAVGDEIIGSHEHRMMGNSYLDIERMTRNAFRDKQRFKLKEIVTSLEK